MAENEENLGKLIAARHERARLLGFSSHAECRISQQMASTPKTVMDFLADASARLEPGLVKDVAALVARKEKDVGGGGKEGAAGLKSADVSFYSRMLKEELLQVDEQMVREYFPLEHCIPAVQQLYEEMLGLKFVKLDEDAAGAWHDTVEGFAVLDKASGATIGHFYLDLFSRDGKFGHQMVIPLSPSFVRQHQQPNDGEEAEQVEGVEEAGGGRRINPVCAIIGNMTKPTATQPSLLRFAEVETFFHEFGHVMHCVLTKVDYSRLAWTWPMMPWPGGVEQDFLEVPSMMLQNLVYRPDIMARLSRHYETSEPLPEDVIGRIGQAKHFMAAYSWRRFIAMATFDMVVHSSLPPYSHGGRSDLTARQLWGLLLEEKTLCEQPSSEGGAFAPASWYHLVIGYDAG